MMSKNLKQIRFLIEPYKKKFPIISRYEIIKNLISDYNRSGLYDEKEQKQKERFFLVKCLITEFTQTPFFEKSQRYDLFRRLRLNLNENELSNITADILNPKKVPFGKAVLCQLLEETGKKEIAKIIGATDESQIKVKREQAGENSRIDIRIYTENPPNKENAIIDIEFKNRSGFETVHPKDGRYQTDREWEDLEKLAAEKNIKGRNIAAYFITPYGSPASNMKFESFSRYDLNRIIRDALNDYMEENKSINADGVDAIGSLRHFFNSRWLF